MDKLRRTNSGSLDETPSTAAPTRPTHNVTFVDYLQTRKKKKPRLGPCDCDLKTKRLLSAGAGFEQKLLAPTVRRGRILAEITGPGPACVGLPALVGAKVIDSKKKAAPSYTFGKIHLKKNDSIGPGPAQYNIVGYGVKGKDSPPAMSVRSRPKPLKVFKTPPPDTYDLTKSVKMVADAPPKYSFGYKPNIERISITPAPNVYRIPTVLGSSKDGAIKSAPAFSITGKQRPRRQWVHMVPGPGAYDGQYRIGIKRPPMYTMGIKHKVIYDAHMCKKPGPAAHCPEKSYVNSKSVPAPSFYIRHTKLGAVQKFHVIPDSLNRTLTSEKCL